jgi:hypothetical protein
MSPPTTVCDTDADEEAPEAIAFETSTLVAALRPVEVNAER